MITWITCERCQSLMESTLIASGKVTFMRPFYAIVYTILFVISIMTCIGAVVCLPIGIYVMYMQKSEIKIWQCPSCGNMINRNE